MAYVPYMSQESDYPTYARSPPNNYRALMIAIVLVSSTVVCGVGARYYRDLHIRLAISAPELLLSSHNIMVDLNTVLVDNINDLHICLSALHSPEPPVHIAVDLEGINLCRSGRVCIIQLFAKDSDTIWLIDVTTLGGVAFDDVDDQGRSLRGLLEDRAITKYMYDVRNDSDALYNPHRVILANVYDLQLLELAMRATQRKSTRWLHGLKKSISEHLIIPKEWELVKDAGCALFAPGLGGQYEVFEQRPLDPRIIAYCALDVALLFDLEAALKRNIGHRALGSWENRIVAESAERVKVAYDPLYQPNGRHKALAPFGWQ